LGISFFEKPVREIQLRDIEQLVGEGYPEGYEVEFKQTLPDKQGKVAPWLAGKNEVSDYARDEILAEAVAFANAQGGFVIVGIAETKEKPPRASSIVPLPRVGELARRFEDQARACIDPPLPRLEVHPVITSGDKGILVLHCNASRSAPHRLNSTGAAFVRRGSSTVRMTMRDIQEMTLNVARGFEEIMKTFSRRRSVFAEWCNEIECAGFRVTGVPLEKLPDPGRLFGRADFGLMTKDFDATFNGRKMKLQTPLLATDERPIVRGIRQSSHSAAEGLIYDQFQDGLVDVWFRNPVKSPRAQWSDELGLFHSWVLGGVASALTLLDRLRKSAGAPNAEYALKVEIAKFPSTLESDLTYHGPFSNSGMDRHVLRGLPLVLPHLPVGSPDDFDQVISLIDTDIYDALGIRRQAPAIQVHW